MTEDQRAEELQLQAEAAQLADSAATAARILAALAEEFAGGRLNRSWRDDLDNVHAYLREFELALGYEA